MRKTSAGTSTGTVISEYIGTDSGSLRLDFKLMVLHYGFENFVMVRYGCENFKNQFEIP